MWYLLESRSDSAVPSQAWKAQAQESLVCSDCRSTKPDVGCIDVQMEDIPDPGAGIGDVDGPLLLWYARRDFLSLFGDAVAQHAHLGNVFDEAGRELSDYAILTPKHPQVVLRGNRNSEYKRRFATCGQVMYFPLGPPYHVLRRDMGSPSLYVDDLGLLVDEELFRAVDRKRWNKLSVSKVRVVDEPEDGHPAEL